MDIRIDELPTTAFAAPDHVIPVMKDGASGQLFLRQLSLLRFLTKAANYNLAADDRWTLIECTAGLTLNLPAASVAGNGFAFMPKANGGTVTLDPNGAELIDGASNVVLADGDFVIVECDGVAWHTSLSSAVKRNDAINTKSNDIASAATTNLAMATGVVVNVTGSATVTSLGTVAAGAERVLIFAGAATLTHNAVSLILPGGANIVTAAGDVAIARSLGAGNWKVTSYQRAAAVPAAQTPFGAVRQQIFSVSGTYTPHANMLFCLVECIGGGGGGGGAAATAASTINGGGGGGGGEYSQSILTKAQVAASKAVVVGAGGGGGVAGANNGSNGGTTSLGGTLVTAAGGTGGTGAPSANAGAGGAGGTGGTGDFKTPGERGSNGGFASNQGVALPTFGGKGGNSMFGFGGVGTVGAVGQAGTGFGSGGGGASDSVNPAKAGGAGLSGVIRITEYCSQ
ncbi:hypothetical protein FHT77_000947 [Rhizobium sp. BK181]|uniref:glycine-rich domain-containing protein n=1 Tax=Rhizobium sp. BK181 TaxID=2587072 RepID=UPI0016222B78|nr:hypothetical protein [Rhizobium sp. BK181]MBB3315105.1 hypothetical protein [Rhizobium sp. BK181]